ncbi:hypothetical protein MTR67_026440 [Solanum verrucosum]|uniref:Uncharacterized protein n=1 Tax=Solanum verrucosum TaxID=315347 RepID=A0AAF0TZ72_SOLVR|nr:hypothetical protein MTR67_026440 [Solanum verrucosum]
MSSGGGERISHDTHLFDVPFGTADPRAYYLNYRRPVSASSTLQALPIRRYEDLTLQAIRRPRPLLAGRISDGTPSPTAAPSATQDDEMPTLAPGQKNRLEQAKKSRGSLKGGTLHTGGAKTVGTITREMEKELGRTLIEPKVFKKTHVKKKENESDLDVWVEERAEQTFSGLQDIGSSRQAEALDGVQIAAISAQIAHLTSALAELERRRVAEQQSMSATV